MRLWVLSVLACLWPAMATAAPVAAPPTPEAVTALVRDHLNRSGTPGAQVMVVQGGRSLYAQAFGGCGLRPMTLNDPLPLGALSQPMLGAAALRLDAAGRADLDKPAPGLMEAPRQALSRPAYDPTPIAASISASAGKPFPLATVDELFKPLGMTSSAALPGLARACGTQPAFGIALPWFEGARSAGPLSASGEDVARFAWAVTAARSASGLLPNMLWDGPDGFHNGWRRTHWHGEPVFWREGETEGFSSGVAILPQRDLAVVVLTNQGAGLKQHPTTNLLRALVAQQQGLNPPAPEFPWERLLRLVLGLAVLAVALRAADLVWKALEKKQKPGALGFAGAFIFLAAPWAFAWLLADRMGVPPALVWSRAPDAVIAVVLFCLSGAALALYGRPVTQTARKTARETRPAPMFLEGHSV